MPGGLFGGIELVLRIVGRQAVLVDGLARTACAPDIELVLARRIEIAVTAGGEIGGHGHARCRQGNERQQSKTDTQGLHG